MIYKKQNTKYKRKTVRKYKKKNKTAKRKSKGGKLSKTTEINLWKKLENNLNEAIYLVEEDIIYIDEKIDNIIGFMVEKGLANMDIEEETTEQSKYNNKIKKLFRELINYRMYLGNMKDILKNTGIEELQNKIDTILDEIKDESLRIRSVIVNTKIE
jgi:hypothetical protein